MIIFIIYLTLCTNLISTSGIIDDFTKYDSCAKCIGQNTNNVWCSDKNHTVPRCALKSTLKKDWCKSIVNPPTETPKFIRNFDFRPQTRKISAVQIKPQELFVKTRVGDKISFEFRYKPAQDYPIDIYYLFDNSYTMSKHKEKLVEQAQRIHDELEKISNNVHFGAGSFIEKLALPFANPNKHKANTFVNHISLTENISEFVKIVRKVQSGGNYDDPECGLDALMQVMVCDQIKWRKEARRMIIVSTDGPYHSAGDGKFVGAYKHNDMKCHLVNVNGDSSSSHTYEPEAALTYDYPSVSQINKIASEGDFSIYFTTVKNVSADFKALAKSIQGAKYAELSNDPNSEGSGGLVELIKKEYLALVHNLEIDTGEIPPHINLTIEPNCKKNVHNRLCEIAHAKSLTIKGTIEVKRCVQENKIDTLTIKPVGLPENFTVNVESICKCECEKDIYREKQSEMCSNSGTYQCGVCECYKNRYGSNCECVGTSTVKRDLQQCKFKENDINPCSGRGNCICGICNCWEGYDGKHCEFRTNDCPAFEDKVCGNHGKCEEKKCKCSPGWKGIDCTCPTNTYICLGANSEVCSGHGKCECGTCECTAFDSNKKLYRGKYCDICDTCVANRCRQLEDYVNCKYNTYINITTNSNLKEECDEFRTKGGQRIVYFKNVTEMKDVTEGYKCKNIRTNDNSSIVFRYLDGNNSTEIWIQTEKEPPLPPSEIPLIPTIGGVLGGILLIGILTVIVWKILVDIHDRREYQKFVEESKAAGFDVSMNPLYAPPAININNPAYDATQIHFDKKDT